MMDSESASEPLACFTYGSLMWVDIMARVCGREAASLQAMPAWLAGHARHPVVGQDYPGLIVQPDAAPVQGVLYPELAPAEFERLDAFEGEEYERLRVEVALQDPATGAGPTAWAWVYRFRTEFAHRLAPGEWSVEAFEAQGKARFCARYVGFTHTPAP